MIDKNLSAKYKAFYEKELSKIEKLFGQILKSRKPRSLYEPCSYVLEAHGKRIRPMLVILSARAVNNKIRNIYNAALAVELLHNFTLVHDDIMDNSDTRRGKPTVHIKYDLNTAILSGDSLASLAYEYLLKDCPNDCKDIVISFTKGLIEVCEGQSLDKEFELRKDVGIQEYKKMIYKKTAAMMEMCCAIGVRLGGGSDLQIKFLSEFGKNIGMAFQIQDDLLDISADENELGKPIGGDLAEGKKNYLFLRALEKAKGSDKKSLREVIHNKGVDKKLIDKYREIYERLGVIDDAKKEIVFYTNSAKKDLNKLPETQIKHYLGLLAENLIHRNK